MCQGVIWHLEGESCCRQIQIARFAGPESCSPSRTRDVPAARIQQEVTLPVLANVQLPNLLIQKHDFLSGRYFLRDHVLHSWLVYINKWFWIHHESIIQCECICTHTHALLLFNAVYLYSCIYVFITPSIKINNEEVFEVSLCAKQKSRWNFSLFFNINTVEILHV